MPSQASRSSGGTAYRLVTMLYDRMQRVRSAARFVFRNHPDIVRQATSAYQRSRRARHRRDATTADTLTNTTTA